MSDRQDAGQCRAELQHAVGGIQRLGFLLAGLGVLAAVLRGTVTAGLPRIVPLVLIVTALGLLAIGALRRTRYHLRQMRRL